MPRSPSPTNSRSRSPPRRSKPKASGFRWKDKPRNGDIVADDGSNDRSLERGYRHERDGYRERDDQRKERSRSRERQQRRRDEDDEERRARKERKKMKERERESMEKPVTEEPNGTASAIASAPANASRTIDDDIAAKFGPSAKYTSTSKPSTTVESDTSVPPQRAAPLQSSAAAPRMASGPMIVVKVNDRLGTTSKIPCLASDTVGDFKKLVAMRIGRKPHEIMLKRQSERPFKDFLTLEDYGVSDGVQLDLELDTGD